MFNIRLNDSAMRSEVARIIFFRLDEQISGEHITEKAWARLVAGWIENPALFPAVETCMDADEEILEHLQKNSLSQSKRRGTPHLCM